MNETRTITIDGTVYDVDTLSGEARTHIVNLRATDREIEHLHTRLGIAQTARSAYAQALKAELSGKPDGGQA